MSCSKAVGHTIETETLHTVTDLKQGHMHNRGLCWLKTVRIIL